MFTLTREVMSWSLRESIKSESDKTQRERKREARGGSRSAGVHGHFDLVISPPHEIFEQTFK